MAYYCSHKDQFEWQDKDLLPDWDNWDKVRKGGMGEEVVAAAEAAGGS
jgi:hypothetical protein